MASLHSQEDDELGKKQKQKQKQKKKRCLCIEEVEGNFSAQTETEKKVNSQEKSLLNKKSTSRLNSLRKVSPYFQKNEKNKELQSQSQVTPPSQFFHNNITVIDLPSVEIFNNSKKKKKRERDDKSSNTMEPCKAPSRCCVKGLLSVLEKTEPGLESNESDAIVAKECKRLDDVLSRHIYKTRDDMKVPKLQGDGEKNKELDLNLKVFGGNKTYEAGNQVVALPSICANLEERKELASVSMRKRNNEKGNCIADVEIRKVSPYFHTSMGQHEAIDEGKDIKVKLPKQCSKSHSVNGDLLEGYDGSITSPNEARIPVGINIVLSASQKRDDAYQRKSLDDTWKPPRSEFGLLQQDHAHDPRRVLVNCNRTSGAQNFQNMEPCEAPNNSWVTKKKRTDRRCCVKGLLSVLDKTEPSLEINERDAIIAKECKRLDDVLSRYIYKGDCETNKTRDDMKVLKLQGDEEKNNKIKELDLSFKNFKLFNGNKTYEAGNQVVSLPSICANLKEKKEQPNVAEIASVSKRRRNNEKGNCIAHVEVRKVSPFFHTLTAMGQQEVIDGGNDIKVKLPKQCSKNRSVKVSPYFQKASKEIASGDLLEGKNGCITSPNKARRRGESITVRSASRKLDDAYQRKSPDNTWKPPCFGLLQEKHAHDPWRVLVICMLLNCTTGVQVRRVISKLFIVCPDAKTATEVATEDIELIIETLGLQRKRALMIQRFSREYLGESWTHVTQLHGIGKYAADAYAMFCTGKWDMVTPADHKLNYYWKFLCSVKDML